MADEFNNEMNVKKNYENVFLRSVIVSFTSFMSDIIEFERHKKGKTEIIKCPVFYSYTGDQAFLSDMFLDSHRFPYSGGKQLAEGNVMPIPSGTFSVKESGVQNSSVSGGNERILYFVDEENEHGVQPQVPYSARGVWFPESFLVDLEIKASSELDRLKIYDAIIENLYKTRKTYIDDYKGFKKIPLTIAFPETQQLSRSFSFFANSQSDLPSLKLQLEIYTKRPIIDKSTAQKLDTKVKSIHIDEYLKSVGEEGNELLGSSDIN